MREQLSLSSVKVLSSCKSVVYACLLFKILNILHRFLFSFDFIHTSLFFFKFDINQVMFLLPSSFHFVPSPGLFLLSRRPNRAAPLSNKVDSGIAGDSFTDDGTTTRGDVC